MTRVLIYCPLNPRHPRIYPETLQSILALDWDKPLEIVFGRDDMSYTPHTDEKYTNLTAKYNRARLLALAGGYDALLTIEADMIVPSMALQRMSRVDADVIYALYCSRRPGRRVGPSRWLVFSEVSGENGNGFRAAKAERTPDNRRALWGSVVESKGMGLGCTLIRRQVLEKIHFRCPDPEVSNDWYLSLDCQAHGFSQAHDCGVVCGHIDEDAVLWPDIERGCLIEE